MAQLFFLAVGEELNSRLRSLSPSDKRGHSQENVFWGQLMLFRARARGEAGGAEGTDATNPEKHRDDAQQEDESAGETAHAPAAVQPTTTKPTTAKK